MCTWLRKCTEGGIVPRLTILKKHGSELKFCLDFLKTRSDQSTKSRKVAAFENYEIFPNLYFSYVRDYKATLSGGNNSKTKIGCYYLIDADVISYFVASKGKKIQKTDENGLIRRCKNPYLLRYLINFNAISRKTGRARNIHPIFFLNSKKKK